MKLVPGARKAWKWFSVQAFVLAGSLQGVWVGLPADMKASVPDGVITYATLAICILGVIGRLTDQKE